jgi:deoxyribodipyrimidine photo-lyase
MEQLKKFDRSETYIKKWIPEFGSNKYPSPIIEHRYARIRALEKYKRGIKN